MEERLAGWPIAVSDDFASVLLERGEFIVCWWLRVRVILLIEAEFVVASSEGAQLLVQLGDPLAARALGQAARLEGVEVAREGGVCALDRGIDMVDFALTVRSVLLPLDDRCIDGLAH
ncbi:MAG TPA: hypothetical protein VIJ39_04535 [Solirubrobacteraceae bacterium]